MRVARATKGGDVVAGIVCTHHYRRTLDSIYETQARTVDHRQKLLFEERSGEIIASTNAVEDEFTPLSQLPVLN